MQESLRQYYLNQLGIASYRARWPLPGAAPSLEMYLEEEEVSTASLPETESNNDVATIEISSVESKQHHDPVADGSAQRAIGELTESLGAKNSRPAVASIDKNVAAESNAPKKPALGFQLSICRVAAQILVVDSSPSQLALPTKKLLQNIVTALGFATEQLTAAERLQWPLHRDLQVHQEDEGRAMLQAFYEAQLDKHQFRYLLLMGEPAIRYSLSAETVELQELQQLYGQSIHLEKLSRAEDPVVAVMVPSLVEMLQQPLTKKIAWQAMQPLRINK